MCGRTAAVLELGAMFIDVVALYGDASGSAVHLVSEVLAVGSSLEILLGQHEADLMFMSQGRTQPVLEERQRLGIGCKTRHGTA